MPGSSSVSRSSSFSIPATPASSMEPAAEQARAARSANSGSHIREALPALTAFRTADASSPADTKDTAGYWRNFSLACDADCKTTLLLSSAQGMTIDRKQIASPISEHTFVNSSGTQCVRNPGHELKLQLAAAVGNMSAATPADARSTAAGLSTVRPSSRTRTSANAPSVVSSIILHGHSNVFAQVNPSGALAIKDAQSSQLALAQSPDDIAIPQTRPVLQRSLSASDATPGKSPLENRNAGHDWLLYALQSNRGSMLQFVSRNSHVAGSNGKEVPLLTQLKAQLAKASANGGEVKLDEHHTLVSIDHDLDADQWKGGQHVVGLKTATLTVKVQQNGAEAFKRITLTQVAPPFENRLLKADHLKIVHDICKDAALDLNQTVVFSYAGVGRNATLAVYDQLMRAIENGSITTAAELEESMRELVKSGRSVHHQNFVQSDEQLAQLYAAAYRSLIAKHPDAEIQTRSGAAIQTSSRAADQNEQDRAHINQLASTIMRNAVAASGQLGSDDDANSLDSRESGPAQMATPSRASSRRSSFSDSGSYNSGRNSAPNSQELPYNFMRFYSGQNTPSTPDEDILYTRGLPAGSSDSGSFRDSLSALDIQAALNAAVDVGTDPQTLAATDGLLLTPVHSEASSSKSLWFSDDIDSAPPSRRQSHAGG